HQIQAAQGPADPRKSRSPALGCPRLHSLPAEQETLFPGCAPLRSQSRSSNSPALDRQDSEAESVFWKAGLFTQPRPGASLRGLSRRPYSRELPRARDELPRARERSSARGHSKPVQGGDRTQPVEAPAQRSFRPRRRNAVMSIRSDLIVGWCPGALRPMKSGDGLIVRVRPRFSRLSLVQLETLGLAAQRFGDGNLYLSNRANVQIRGASAEEHATLLDVLAVANLIDSDPRVEAVRNIMVSPAVGLSAHAELAAGLVAKLE